MSDDKLCECDHCGVLRVYEAGKSCPGCGAPLTPGERVPLSEPDAAERNNNLRFLEQARGMQQMSQQQMNQMAGLGQQQSQYQQMLGMQQSMINQELAAIFGVPRETSGRGKK